jgi:glycine cleavage system aminomethyltransferase T
VSYQKEYVGSAALTARRRSGVRRRLTCLIGAAPLAPKDAVLLDGEPIGTVVNAGFSSVRGDYVAAALLDVRWAHASVDRYEVVHEGAASPVRTVSPPVLDNRSLWVSPMRHGYATRSGDDLPPLVR